MGRAEDRTLKVRNAARSFAAGERGSITIFAIIAFALLMGLVGLVIDVGRVMNIHSQASSYADRVALAAAAELDRRGGALDRAVNAAQGANRQIQPGYRFSLGADTAVGVSRLIFMNDLNADSSDPYAATPLASETGFVTAIWTSGGISYRNGYNATTAVRDTAFVVVETTLEQENFLFFNLVTGLVPGIASQASVAPQAVAGFVRELCNAPPLAICNLNEATSGTGAPFTFTPGQMVRAKMQGNSSSWGPGFFGLLDTPDGNGANAYRDFVGRVNANTQCIRDASSVRNGQATGPVSQGFNTRFDIYDGAMNSERNNAEFAPAYNVFKGLRRQGNACGNVRNNAPSSTPFPRDNCFMPSGAWPAGIPSGAGTGCVNYSGTARAGDGNWNRAGYWTSNHPSDTQPAGYNTMSRYQVYRYEIDNNLRPNRPSESGAPSCSSTTPINTEALDRRVLPVAVVNCVENPPSSGVVIEEIAQVFLTEPVGNTEWWNATNDDIWVEILGVVKANAPTSQVREFPVLYR